MARAAKIALMTASALAVVTFSHQTAAAQAAASPTAENVVPEVIVTAQRRNESVQKTPVAVTAVSDALFQKAGGGNVATLTSLTPNIQISLDGVGGGQIGVRGITTSNTTDVGDPAVVFSVDGVYRARAQSIGAGFFDVERVEVLRGPQGTLYGRNATSGVINVITRKPTQDASVNGFVEAGNYGTVNAFVGATLPINDTLSLRLAAITQNHSPYYNNAPSPRNYGNQHEVGGRAHLLWTPTENLSVLVTGEYSDLNGHGGPALPAAAVPLPLDSDPYTFPVGKGGNINNTQYGGRLAVNYTLPFATLTYEGAARHTTARFTGGFTGGDGLLITDPTQSKTQQHEVRLSNSTDKLNWVAGLYYYKENQVWNVYVPPFVAFLMPWEEATSKAAFGQVTYSPVERLRITGGLRYTEDTKARTGGNYGYDASGKPTVLLLANNAAVDSNKTTYRVGADFDLSSSIMIYASYATGYKAGGFFDGSPPGNTYLPENVGSSEVGVKGRFFDRRLTLNLAAFRQNYTDFQATYQDQATLITKTFNAQKAVNDGVELEAQAVLGPNDRLGGSVSYLHARYKTFTFPGGAIDTYGNSSYSGNRLPYAPDWQINVNYDHTWRVGDDRVTATIISHYQSASDLDFRNYAVTRQKAYTKTDLNLEYANGDDRWAVSLYVRNLEDKAILTNATVDAPPNVTTGSGVLAAPRTFGARLTFNLQ